MVDYNINLTISTIWKVFRVLIDIGIMWLVFYLAIKAVRNNSRTVQIFKGIIAIVAINGLSKILGLSTVTYFTNLFLNWGLLAIFIIFQPEIRGLLEKIGKSNAFSRINSLLANEREDLVKQLYEATITLSKSNTGALISIEQSQSMQDYIKTGIEVNAKVSKELLCSIFMTTTPLHDGAVIIQGDKVACASAYFPPTAVNLASRYGARHRAALGISEVCDALTIVVSEETSAISIAEKGRIFSVDEKQLKEYLQRVICNDSTEINSVSKKRSNLIIDQEVAQIADKENDHHHFFNFSFKKGKDGDETIAVNDEKEQLDMKVPFNNRLKQKSLGDNYEVVDQGDSSEEEFIIEDERKGEKDGE